MMNPNNDDRALVDRVVLLDDRHAFATLVRHHQAAVRAFLVRLCCGDEELAADLAQDTFLRGYQRLASWRREGALASWLFGIAYRAFLTERRRARCEREVLVDELPALAAPETADRLLLARDIARAMSWLRAEERACIALCLQRELTHDEAAHVLALPVGTVKTHILRGRAKLAARLPGWRDDPSLVGAA
jgi:RNA polymerase sigma-70 factor (ECF subfamily)